MKRMLVVVDSSVQAHFALDQALEFAHALPSSEVILLSVLPPLSSWQVRRSARHDRSHIPERVTELALGRAKSAGVTARRRIESGEIAEVAARVAREERCDHIFLPEQGLTSVGRALLTLTGLSMNSAASRILSLSSLPVTVVTDERREKA